MRRATVRPSLPAELEGAIHSLYGHYRQQFERWQADAARQAGGATPPVFVVVCNNTSVSKLVFDYVAGWSKTLSDGTEVAVTRGTAAVQQRRGRPLVVAAQEHPRGLRAARIRRRHERRVQAHRRRRDRGVQGGIPSALSWTRRRRH